MKKTVKRVLASALSLCLLFSLTIPQALAVKTGSLGSNLTWKVKGSTLTISGKGAMEEFDSDESPWAAEGIDNCDLKKIVIKEGVTSLCDSAFNCYDYVKSISLPKSLKKFGFMALNGTSLKEVRLAKGSKYFSTKGGVLFNKKKTTLVYYPTRKKGKSYTVPSSVKTIAAGAFCGQMDIYSANPYLKKLIIPKNVRTVQDCAFSETDIQVFQFQGTPPKIHAGAFSGSSVKILYPKKLRSKWKSTIEALKEECKATQEDEDEEEELVTELTFQWY